MPDTGPVISAENLFLDHAGVNGVFKWLSEKSNRAVLKLVVMRDCNNQTNICLFLAEFFQDFLFRQKESLAH